MKSMFQGKKKFKKEKLNKTISRLTLTLNILLFMSWLS